MGRVYDNAYWTVFPTGSQIDQFAKLGDPGKYHSVITHASGQTDLTGSNFGYSAIMIGSGSSSEFGPEDTVTLSRGGTVLLRDMASIHGTAANEIRTSILELSLAQVSSSAGAPTVYLFKRQQ